MKQDIELKWAENVAKAKEVCGNQNKSQMIIAGLALEVCEITRGGFQHRTSDKFTLKRFAEEIGVNAKTLSNWVAVRSLVFNRIDKSDAHKATFTQLAHVAMRVKPDSPAKFVKEKFQEITQGNTQTQSALIYLKALRSLAFHFATQDGAKNIGIKVQKETLFYCEQIIKSILKETPDLKGENLKMATLNDIGLMSAANALGLPKNHIETVYVSDMGHRIKITDKDRHVARYLRNKKIWRTPTYMGEQLHGFNKNSVLRCLNKLVSIDMIEKNEHGHYKWKE